MDPQNYDFYKKLRSKYRKWLRTRRGSTSKWPEYLMFAPDMFHLLCKLAIDVNVPIKERAKLAATVAYFVSPFDLMPEMFVGFIGFADDIALAAYILNSMLNRCEPELLRKHWAGEEDVLDLVQRILTRGDSFIGKGRSGKGVLKKAKRILKLE